MPDDTRIGEQMAERLSLCFETEGFEIFWKAYALAVNKAKAEKVNFKIAGAKNFTEILTQAAYWEGYLDGVLSLGYLRANLPTALKDGDVDPKILSAESNDE